ncbi:beta-galactosidase [Abditibacteriota bacterium]|nr:beta-galactosidase [Abditibacteriota bacterium]
MEINLNVLKWTIGVVLIGSRTPTHAAPSVSRFMPAPKSQKTTTLKYLTTEMAASVTQGWKQTQTDLSITGAPLSIAGRRFEHGLGTHAPGEILFQLGHARHRFQAEIGVDDGAGDVGSVVFKVMLDGREAFNSGVTKAGQPARKIDLDVSGVAEMRLVVTDGGDGVQGDHADWADAAVDRVGNDDRIAVDPVPPFSSAGFFAIKDSPRRVFNFNPGWRFLKTDASGAQKPEFDDSKWQAADLPHGLEILPENASGMRNYQGPAWYRKRFTIPTAKQGQTSGRRFMLYFEAVMGKATVWVNGQQVARHFGGYLPFAADITRVVRANGANVVAVRADNSDDPLYPPGKPQDSLDFAYLGGIYRDCFLIETGSLHVSLPELSPTVAGGGVFVATTGVDGPNAQITVKTEAVNQTATTQQMVLRSVLETQDGQEVLHQETPVPLKSGESREVEQHLSAQNVHLWHPDDPYLHFIRTELLVGGRVVDSFHTRFGIRLFEMRGQEGFFINGKFIGHKLSGVNRHQDYVYVGNALPNSGQWRDAKLLREGGSTIVRAAHYPLDPAFLDACDELGLLVTTANPGWQFYNDKAPIFEQRLYQDTRNLVRRDRNRPAMLLWETALNETPSQLPSVLSNMHRYAHEEFPFPGLFTVADVDEGKKGGFDFYYFGSNDGTKNSFTREYGDGGEVENFYSQNAMTRVKREWGEQALLNQSLIRASYLPGVFGTPPINLGAAVWAGIDHQRGYHPDPFLGGLLDVFRIPKYSYQVFKSQYAPDFKLKGIETGPMVFIAHELTQVSGKDVVVFTNCEQVRLTWLGKVVGTAKPETNYQGMPHPPVIFHDVFDFHKISRDWRDKTGDITMIAEGLINDQVVCHEVKRYAERTSAIRLTSDGAGVGLTADGADFIPLRATVVDNKGVPKVLASENVRFEVEGPGQIIGGAENGSNPMKTQFGTATALLRATTQAGTIGVRAYANGLKADELVVASTAPTTPLLFDKNYAATSRAVGAGATRTQIATVRASGGDTEKLQEEIRRLRLELVSKEQDIMDLRNKVKK